MSDSDTFIFNTKILNLNFDLINTFYFFEFWYKTVSNQVRIQTPNLNCIRIQTLYVVQNIQYP